MYEAFEHTADIGLRVQADTLEQLLTEAARGLFSLIVTNLEDVRPLLEETWQIERDEIENDYLLFDWLSELLYRFDTQRLLMCEFQLELQPDRLLATCRGETTDPSRHQLEHEVKAITYHALTVTEQDGQWQAEVIVDI